MALSDLFFWTGADNNTGLENIRGDELAGMVHGNAGKGASASIFFPVVVPNTVSPALAALNVIPLDEVRYDDLGFFDAGSGSFIIPETDPVITRVVVYAKIEFIPSITGTWRRVGSIFNGATIPDEENADQLLPLVNNASYATILSAGSAAIPVVPGDQFQLGAAHDETAGITINPISSFGIVVVG